MSKQRIDTLLVGRGLAKSREKARALVMAGQVLVADRPVTKPGTLIDEEAALSLASRPRYVSRGGEKLEYALQAFRIDVGGLVCADVGASTGGFTDCLLQQGAARVYAIDVGKGQLDWRLRQDPRVVVMEGVNVRTLPSLPEPVDLVTVDVSFISLRLVLPVVRGWLGAAVAEGGTGPSIIALFKPQFEAEKGEVPRGGVIRDPQLHAMLIGRFAAWSAHDGFRVVDMTASPIAGAKGNTEFLFWLRPVDSGERAGGEG